MHPSRRGVRDVKGDALSFGNYGLGTGVRVNRFVGIEAEVASFEIDPVETLGELHVQGGELAPAEIDLFLESDVRMSWIE